MMLLSIQSRRRIVGIVVSLMLLTVSFPAKYVPANSNHDSDRPLVIVGGDCDQELWMLRRLAGHVAEVRALRPNKYEDASEGKSEDSASGYEACNRRVLAMRRFVLYFAEAGTVDPCEQMWQQRLRALNPEAKFHGFRADRGAAGCRWRRAACLARAFHHQLVILLPHGRAELDANLAAELTRCRNAQAVARSNDGNFPQFVEADE